MNYQQALAYIHSLLQFGSKPGLDRVSRLVSLAGNPEKDLKFIHIAGTSGKGSTASYCASILEKSGYKVGLYTSPYVTDFRERFIINGEMIGKDDFCSLCEFLKEKVELLNAEGVIITEFEFNTVLGLLWFKQQGCDIVCLEVGMGGRFDATNIIPCPEVSVITRIGLDHTAYLGTSLKEIDFEKCGIVKGGKTVTYPDQKSEALLEIERICKCKGSKLYTPNLADITDIELNVGGSSFKFEGKSYVLNMSGEHQIHNAVTAVCAVNLLSESGFKISDDAIYEGLFNVKCPARLEILSKAPLIIIDGAHNSDKISSLYEVVKCFSGEIISVCGMLRDKDYALAVEKIAPLCKKIYTVSPDNPRALSAEEFAAECEKFCGEVTAMDCISDAVSAAYSQLKDGDVFLCWGSLYIAGNVRSEILRLLK